MKTEVIMAKLQAKYPNEKEYLQAVQEVLESIEEVYNQHPEYEKAKIVERMVEPDRIFTFRVTWVDPFNAQVPRIRADFQERAHHSPYGRCERWFGLRPCRKVK